MCITHRYRTNDHDYTNIYPGWESLCICCKLTNSQELAATGCRKQHTVALWCSWGGLCGVPWEMPVSSSGLQWADNNDDNEQIDTDCFS